MTGQRKMRRLRRVLVTRPQPDAAPLKDALRARGFEVLLEPMLEIVHLPGPEPPLDGVQALLFTSANGVRAFVARSPRRDLVVYAVGDATAATARDAGFAEVHSAGGDVRTLAALVRARARPGNGALLHAAGSAVAGDLAGLLAEAGFDVRREVLYEARESECLGTATQRALEAGEVDAVLLFSPRTAASFVSLVQAAGLAAACRRVEAVCLSPAVATAASAVEWRRIAVAKSPDQIALLAVLET